MFRLWFMTFFGLYRGEPDYAHGHGAPGGHGHGGIHESPKIMLVPLIILAFLSFVGGWIGVPGSLGGGNHFDKFLGPVFRSTSPSLNSAHQAAGEKAPPENQTEGAEPQTGRGTELAFTGISVLAGLLGLGLAYLLYYRNPELPQRIATSLGGFYEAVKNKYYVDEIYGAVFIKPLIDLSSKVFWKGIDQGLIDTSINDAADASRDVSDAVRRMQSGNIRSYASWVAVGAACVLAYMVWMGTR
jgi:NADH-quinone oxidoreductase subunit L